MPKTSLEIGQGPRENLESFVGLVGAALGLNKSELATVRLAPDEKGDVIFYQVYTTVEGPFRKLEARLKQYVEDRADGHTRECLLAAFTNRSVVCSISDQKLRIMVETEPCFSASLWKRGESRRLLGLGATEVWETPFVHIDGEIAWLYKLRLQGGGEHSVEYCGKRDAKEFDPKYSAVIGSVMDEVERNMGYAAGEIRSDPLGYGWHQQASGQ